MKSQVKTSIKQKHGSEINEEENNIKGTYSLKICNTI